MSSPTRALSARTLLLRDWRGGELGVLLAALVIAVAVVVGISAFVSSLQSTLETESLRFLAADRVVSSSRPIAASWRSEAKSKGLATAETLGFPSMAMNDADGMHLSSIKAVSDGYPLRGTLQVSADPFGATEVTSSIPKPGEAWLAPRLFALLDVAPGDQIWIGEKALTVSAAIRSEPDSTSALFGYGPRLMMNLADIEATGVIQPGSRVNWRLLLRGQEDALTAFTDWLSPQLSQGQRLLGVDESQPSIGRTLDRAQGFLLLAGSLGVLLAAAAIALAARRFAERHTDYVAIMKSLGASTARIGQLYGQSLALLGLSATVAGCLVGFGLQQIFLVLFGEQLGVAPGSPGLEPFIIGGATSLVCLGFFAWPPLNRLSKVPPLRVLRRDVSAASSQRLSDYAVGGLALFGLMWWYSGNVKLTLGVVAGLLVTVSLGFVAASVLLRSGRLVGSAAGSVWRLALAGLQRRGSANALQMVIFSIAIMLMLVLTMIRTSLIDQWQAQLPPGTPNHFMLNIAPDQKELLAEFFQTNEVPAQPHFPMSRGRVMAVNGEALADSPEEPSTGRQREANFTYATALPEANTLVAGAWWPADSLEPLVSLEESFAESVGAVVGDELTFRIGSEDFSATVASIRESDWQSMKPNFFVIFTPMVLQDFPQMFMTSFYLPSDKKSVLNRLIRQFPTFTVIETDIVIEEIRSIITQVGRAIELVLVVILSAGALVLIAGVQASVDVRLKESALLRALGASRGLLLGALWIEFTTLGVFAGLLATVGAEASAWALQTQALDLSYQPTPMLWPVGIAVGALLIGVLGVWSCRRVVSVPPLVVLREL